MCACEWENRQTPVPLTLPCLWTFYYSDPPPSREKDSKTGYSHTTSKKKHLSWLNGRPLVDGGKFLALGESGNSILLMNMGALFINPRWSYGVEFAKPNWPLKVRPDFWVH